MQVSNDEPDLFPAEGLCLSIKYTLRFLVRRLREQAISHSRFSLLEIIS
jgi:hypothetical protein